MNGDRPRLVRTLAFGWGLAEATFFFIVPDVLSTRLVLTDRRAGFAACGWSLAGALAGGCLLFVLGRNPEAAARLLSVCDAIPGIQPAVIAQAGQGLDQHGAAALFGGFVAGIPYKLYAIQAAGAGMGLGTFLIASAGARLSRFLLTTCLAWGLHRLLLHKLAPVAILRLHAAAWAAFYLLYFWRMGL